MAEKYLQQNNVHAAFSTVLAERFGGTANAPRTAYSPQLADMLRLQRRFRDTPGEHIQAVYEMSHCNYSKAAALLLAARQRDYDAE